MRLEAFFEKFELFADASNALEKMRELVLRLAYSGGLSGDRRGADGVPVGWERRTIDSIASSIVPGFACSKSHQVPDGHVHLRTHNISTLGTLNFDLMIRIDRAMVDAQKSSIRAGDILFNNTNSQELVGKTSLVDRDYEYGFSNHITRLRLKDEVFPGFVAFYLTLLRNSGYFARLCTRWINQAAVNTETLKVQGIPLPPLAVQKRIVAKVDELMALCDRLEAQQQERQTRHAALAHASLARFADAPTPANLDFLFHDAYTIATADLRKSILSLAVQGKLVPQDPGDEPASSVLARLEETGGNARIRRSVPNDVRRSDSVNEENLPDSWAIASTARLLQLGAIYDLKDGNHGANHPKVAEFTSTGLPFITAAQVSDDGEIDYDSAYKVSGEVLQRLRVGFAKPGDVIYTHKGSVGRVAICDRECVLTPQTTYYRLNDEVLSSRFVRFFLRSPFFYDQVDLVKRQTTRDFVSISAQYQFFFRVPPLAEQRRIVTTVDQLMAMVDRLEATLAAAKTKSAALLEAAIHELLNPTAEIIPFPRAERDASPDRAAIGCYAIQQLGDKRTFGRTAEVKVLYLAEAHLGLDLGGRYARDAAGPLDQWIYKFEEEAARQQWFSVVESATKDGHKKIEYRQGPSLSVKAQEATTRLSAAQRLEFDRLLGLLAQRPTVEVEIIATLFAAWNDFLIDGQAPSDAQIIREVRENWHPKKQRFAEAELQAWLAWLRRHALVPRGLGPRTVVQPAQLPLH